MPGLKTAVENLLLCTLCTLEPYLHHIVGKFASDKESFGMEKFGKYVDRSSQK